MTRHGCVICAKRPGKPLTSHKDAPGPISIQTACWRWPSSNGIEILGEAAANVSVPARNRYPEIPWRSIVGMRNRVIHAYYAVDRDRVWDTVIDDLPPLIRQLEDILRRESGEP